MLVAMARYSFEITNGGSSSFEADLVDDEAAWLEALHTVRDIESTLSLEGGVWAIVVARDGKEIFRIDVQAHKIG